MQRLCIALLVLTALCAPAQQTVSGNPASSGKLSIPAQLSKTVRADKAHAGDPVELKTLEAVLVSNGLVMPANTTLHGRVLDARPRQNGKNSWLVVVVERAQWKEHTLPLHAFISEQIAMPRQNNQAADAAIPNNTQPSYPRSRQSGRGGAITDPNLANLTVSGRVRAQRDAAAAEAAPAPTAPNYPALRDVGLLRDKNGTTYLLSAKSNVKLPAGIMLMLRDEPVGNVAATESAVASSLSSAQSQP
jgi:hypothetical protein